VTTGSRSRVERGKPRKAKSRVTRPAKRAGKRAGKRTAKRPSTTPVFRPLSAADALRVLRRNHVGRLAYALHDRVEVQPIHYVMDGRWLYLRTSPGLKTQVLERNRWMAFQTDEVESAFSWRSVIVRGTAYMLSPEAGPDLARRYLRAVRRIRSVMPGALSEDDPVAFRTVIIGVHIDEISGREAVERPARASRKRG
jgi:nitroimidazol reductase NimA-like FMN-containing flavoprotein (pyridoxamine 5'-phosphate oxidase superfamily)